MNSMKRLMVKDFIEFLSGFYDTENYENIYRNEKKRSNLKIYLEEMQKQNPKVLFVGEAPGYLGCGITGIPFTDERVLISNEYSFIPGKGRYYISGNQKEISSKAIWDALKIVSNSGNSLPLLWNAFPFHPFNNGNKFSNRQPDKNEIKQIGMPCIYKLLSLFNIKSIYTIGRNAFYCLSNMELNRMFKAEESFYIRHPAHGGAVECINKIKSIYSLY